MAEQLGGEPTPPAKTTPEGPHTADDYAKVLDNNYEANHAAKAAPDAPEKSPNDDMIDKLSGDKQPNGGKVAADTSTTHADDAADARKAGHGSDDADGKADTDAQQGHDSADRPDADPEAKDHSANGKADDAAHHDGDEHPKDTDDKHTTKNDDADTHKSDKEGDGKSDKDEADAHKSDKDADGKSDKDDADGSGTGDDDPPITTEEQYLAKREKLEDYDHGIVPKEQRKEAYPENWDGDSSTIEGLRESVPARDFIPRLDGPKTNKIGTFDALPDGGSISKRPEQVLDGHPYSDWRYSDHYNPEEKRAAWRNDPDIVDGGVKGTHRRYTVQEYVDKYGSTIDRVGPTSGRFFGAMPEGKIAPLETRSMDPSAVHEPYHQYHVNPDKFDGNWEVEVSVIAPDQFQKGGGLQLRFFDLDGPTPTVPLKAHELLDKKGRLTGETHVVGTVQEHSFSDLK